MCTHDIHGVISYADITNNHRFMTGTLITAVVRERKIWKKNRAIDITHATIIISVVPYYRRPRRSNVPPENLCDIPTYISYNNRDTKHYTYRRINPSIENVYYTAHTYTHIIYRTFWIYVNNDKLPFTELHA